ncbi:hypothetical protein GCM10022205_41780 [Spinactinospora alkalitolerans]
MADGGEGPGVRRFRAVRTALAALGAAVPPHKPAPPLALREPSVSAALPAVAPSRRTPGAPADRSSRSGSAGGRDVDPDFRSASHHGAATRFVLQ